MDFLMCLLCLGILEIDLWQIKISLYVCVSTPGIVCSIGSYIVYSHCTRFEINPVKGKQQ